MNPSDEKPVDHKINRYFFLAIIIVFAVLLYFSLIRFFTAFLGAVIFYILSKRLMENLIKRKRWKKTTAAVFVMLLSFVIIMVPITISIYLLYNKGKYYVAHPDQIVLSLHKIQLVLQQKIGFAVFTDENIGYIKAYATSVISSLLNESLNFFATITVLYFFLYFMLVNINRMEAAIVFYLPFKREKIEIFGKELVNLTISNSVGVPAIAVAQGLVGYVAYLIAGVPEAGFWAVMTGFASIIPIIGTGIIWAPICAYLFIIGHDWQGVFTFLWGLIVLGLTDNVVRFMLAKKMADVHPIITVLGVIMGLKYFGISGIVFGPVLISYFLILLKIYYVEYQHGYPVIKNRRATPVRFNLPFLVTGKKKTTKHESSRSKQ